MLECIVIESSGAIKIKQDLTPLLQEFYTVGNEYPFTVRNDFSRAGYYEISDDYGLYFHLNNRVNNKEINLYIGQKIYCRINKLSGIKVDLVLVKNKEEQQNLKAKNINNCLKCAKLLVIVYKILLIYLALYKELHYLHMEYH